MQLESTCINLHVKQDNNFKRMTQIRSIFWGDYLINIWRRENFADKRKRPNLFQSYSLQKLEDFSGLLLQLLILH